MQIKPRAILFLILILFLAQVEYAEARFALEVIPPNQMGGFVIGESTYHEVQTSLGEPSDSKKNGSIVTASFPDVGLEVSYLGDSGLIISLRATGDFEIHEASDPPYLYNNMPAIQARARLVSRYGPPTLETKPTKDEERFEWGYMHWTFQTRPLTNNSLVMSFKGGVVTKISLYGRAPISGEEQTKYDEKLATQRIRAEQWSKRLAGSLWKTVAIEVGPGSNTSHTGSYHLQSFRDAYIYFDQEGSCLRLDDQLKPKLNACSRVQIDGAELTINKGTDHTIYAAVFSKDDELTGSAWGPGSFSADRWRAERIDASLYTSARQKQQPDTLLAENIEAEIQARIDAGETPPPRVYNPPYRVGFCKASNPAFLETRGPGFELPVGEPGIICENTSRGRAVLRWRAWICRDDRKCTLSSWIGKRPNNADIIVYRSSYSLGSTSQISFQILPPEWSNSAQLVIDDLVRAIASGNEEDFDKLLKQVTEINQTNTAGKQTPLYAASFTNQFFLIDKLITHGADPNIGKDPASPLYIAAREGHVNSVTYLLSAGADTGYSRNGASPLTIAAEKGHGDVVSKLIVFAKSDDPIHKLVLASSVHSRDADLVKRLLAHGFDANGVNHSGSPAIFIAAYLNQMEILNLLLDAGANVNFGGETGLTALHGAASNGKADLIRYVVARGADVSGRDQDGTTALMFAADKGNNTAVRVLLELGADKSLRNKNRWNARKFAKSKKHRDTAKLLK